MNDSSPLNIYAPSLYWFSYFVFDGLTIAVDGDNQPAATDEEQPAIDLHWVKHQYEQIFTAFDLQITLDLVDPTSPQSYNLLKANYPTEPGTKRKRQQTFKTKTGLNGFIYPQAINDTYALNLRVAFPEQYGADQYSYQDLQKLNPAHCFQSSITNRAELLGQTLLLTVYLNQSPPLNPRDLDQAAKDCWCAFFNIEQADIAKFPRLYRVAPCCNGYLYEFGNPRETVNENPYGHLLILFMFDQSTTKLLNKFYWSLPNLLLYRHKISNTFRQSRLFYQTADQIVNKNEQTFNTLKQGYLIRENNQLLSELALNDLKNQLKALLRLSLAYSHQLRNLEYARNTIAINHRNYLATLDTMEQLAAEEKMGQLAPMPLTALRVFGEKEAVTFQDQITADLNYFRHGSGLLDTAINSIRGLVEIDQAERDRARQAQEIQSDRTLQNMIGAIGGGLGVAGVTATAYPYYKNPDPTSSLAPIAEVVGVSLGLGFLAAIILSVLSQRLRSLLHRNDSKD